MRPRLLKLAYQLRYHFWGNWPLDRWLFWLAVAVAIVLGLFRLPRLLNLELAAWLPVVLCALLAAAVLVYGRWAAAESYLVFYPESISPPAGCPLLPADKVLLRATGRFEVEGKAHFFANLLAYWRTFASREHAVMAIVHRSRFLLVGTVPAHTLGMWYIFWCPEKMIDLQPGAVAFGADRRPGLRALYDTPELSAAERRNLPFWQRHRKFSRRETVYLSFDAELDRQRVWGDLLADWDRGATTRLTRT